MRLCIYELHFFWFENMGSSWCLASESPSVCSKYFKRLSTVTSSGWHSQMRHQNVLQKTLQETCSLLVLFLLHEAVDAKPGCFQGFWVHHWVHPSPGTCMSPAGLILPHTNQTSDAASTIRFEKCVFSKSLSNYNFPIPFQPWSCDGFWHLVACANPTELRTRHARFSNANFALHP